MFEPKTNNLKIDNWEDMTSQNILIFGNSKVGKTYTALALVKEEMIKNKDMKVYYINTDMGFSEPAKQLGLVEFKDRIEYYYVREIYEAEELIKKLKGEVKSYDYVVWDLTSWIWEKAQEEYMNFVAGTSKIKFLMKASQNPKNFGNFSGNQWQVIKSIDSNITNFLTRNTLCNVIGITGVKDTELEDMFAKKTQGVYSKVGRPNGRKDLLYEFSTIIRIFRDDETFKRKYLITGTRKVNLKSFKPIEYDEPQEMWKKIREQGVI